MAFDKNSPPPSDTFELIVARVMTPALRIIGLEIFEDNWRMNWRTAVFLVWVIFGNMCEWYTILFMDRYRSLTALTLVFVIQQALVKIIVWTHNAKRIASRMAIVRRFYFQCEQQRSFEWSILACWAGRLRLLTQIFVFNFACLLVLSTAYPIGLYLITGRIDYVLPMYVPFVAIDTPTGVAVNWASQLVLLSISLAGLVGGDTMLIVLNLHTPIMAEVLCAKVEAMGRELRQRNIAERPRCWPKRAAGDRQFWDECIRMHQALSEYVGELSSIFYVIFSTDVGTNFLSMCVMLYVRMQVHFVPIYNYLCIIFAKTFVLCALGTAVDMYMDKVCETFNTFPYYALPFAEQKKLLLVLQRAQMPRVLMSGTFPLNMELFVTVMKNTYSVAMILEAMTDG